MVSGVKGSAGSASPRAKSRSTRIQRATRASVQKGRDQGYITDLDEAAVQVLLWIAKKLDQDDEHNPRLTVATYFSAAAALGLTVQGRERIEKSRGVGGRGDSPLPPKKDPASDPTPAAERPRLAAVGDPAASGMDALGARSRRRFVPDAG